MRVLLRHGSFGYFNVVQRLGAIILFAVFSHQPIGCAFQYSQEYHGIATSGYFHEELSLNWDDLDMQFLSKVHGPKLHSHGFHVINATFPAKKTSYIIHISKTEGLFHPDQLGISPEDANHLDCLYSGTVSEITGGTYSKGGLVSLSTCHHKFGFEGLLLLPHEQYYIRPNPNVTNHHQHYHHQHHNEFYNNIVKRSTDSSKKPLVSHKAFKVNSPGGIYNGNQPVDDILRVPPEELLKASQNQLGNLDSLEDEDTRENVHSTNSMGQENDENTVLDDSLIQSGEDCNDGTDCKNSMPPVMATLSKGKGKQQKRKKAQSKTPKKAKSTKNQVVEIAVFTDKDLYKVWQTLYPKDTTTKMNQYVLAVINNMNVLYKQPSFTDNLSFRLVHMEIETVKPKAMRDHNGHATKYLKSFCGYAAEKNQYGRLWDHALLLTGMDLQESGSNVTAGIAWFSTLCINGLSCSVIEGMNFGSTFITAHEIGHSIGMEHDGTGQNRGCDANSYIMSPTTGGGKTDWSPCSMKNMKDFINKGYMSNPAPTCITKKGAKSDSAIKFSSNKLPGQQFGVNEQCAADCKGCTVYTSNTPPYNNICNALYCQWRKGYLIYYQSLHPALEGTTCAKGRMCRLGECK